MERLLQLGADPAKLFEQFKRREEERQGRQEDIRREAQEKLTEHCVSGERGEIVDLRAYRRATEAEARLVVEPGLPEDEMTYHDFRIVNEAERRGVKPMSVSEYISQAEVK